MVRLSVTWHERSSGWYATLEYPPGTPLASNRRIALHVPILGDIPTALVGDIWCRSRENDEPGEHAWAGSHQLVFQV